MGKPETAVLLSSYNGEKYLIQQIESILKQTYTDFKLYIRDDGSKDNSLAIIESFAKNDDRIIVCDPEHRNNLGIAKSYEKLLYATHADLYFFSDQDDIWFPEKMETLINIYTESCKNEKPCLIYSNSRLYRDDKQAELFYKKPITPTLDNFLFKNGSMQAAGMLFNNELKQLALPFPAASYLHDVHIFLTALLNKAYIKECIAPLMLYRIHSDNTVGKQTFFQKFVSFRKYTKKVFDKQMCPYIQEISQSYSDIEILYTYVSLMQREKSYCRCVKILLKKKYAIDNSRLKLLIKFTLFYFWQG